jgi:ribose transport system ATP-binding protein
VQDISKSYPGTQALQGVSMDISEGEIIGLVGENGAGKSTLLKIIMGIEQPTTGHMYMRGSEYSPKKPKEANLMGVGMVFQEQSLITNLTVGQNIFFGQEKKYRKFGLINWKKLYADAAETLKGFCDIKPRKKVIELDFATRQMVEVAKVLNSAKSSDHKSLILLDEPTSVLNDEEIKRLFFHIENMKKQGNSIIFVSHRLDEVIDISDRIYIFKDGREVGILDKSEAAENILYEKMVGRSSSGEYYKLNKQRQPKEKVVFEVQDLGLEGAFKHVSFQLRKGEILGISGVVGSGKEDLCSVLNGEEKNTSGKMLINNKEVTFNSPYKAMKETVISIPRERREEGIIGILSVMNNISISNLDSVKKRGFVSKKMQLELTEKWVKRLNIKCSSYSESVNQLSGGNAQKVVFARLLASGAQVLILNHPTRGVDVGAKEDIYSIIREIAENGISVILLGDTLDECIGLSNRILVMKDGLVKKEFMATVEEKPAQIEILKYMM